MQFTLHKSAFYIYVFSRNILARLGTTYFTKIVRGALAAAAGHVNKPAWYSGFDGNPISRFEVFHIFATSKYDKVAELRKMGHFMSNDEG